MKKLLLTLIVLGLFCSPAHAKRYFIEEPEVIAASGVTFRASHSMASGTGIYTAPIVVDKNVGFTTLYVDGRCNSCTTDVDISAQYSMDGVNFYTAYTTNMDGTITAEGNIVTALGNVERWIVVPVRMAKFMRFLFDPDAASTIRAELIYQQQR
jgi:hypothetical protein